MEAVAIAVRPRHHNDPPLQPEVARVDFGKSDGSTSSFRARPFLHEPGDWSTRFDSLSSAVAAARKVSSRWEGYVAFGVVQAADGAHLIRPMESHNGRPFPIDGPALAEHGITSVVASATAAELRALVGMGSWIDFSSTRGPASPVPLPA